MVESSPRAFRVLAGLTDLFSKTLTYGLIGGVLVAIFAHPVAGGIIVSASIVTALAALMGRWVVIAMFFSRYSLAHIMQVNFALAILLSFAFLTPGYWCILPILGILALAILVHTFLVVQDPLGLNFTPPFVRAKLMADRKARQRKGQEQEKLKSTEPDSTTGTKTDGEVH